MKTSAIQRLMALCGRSLLAVCVAAAASSGSQALAAHGGGGGGHGEGSATAAALAVGTWAADSAAITWVVAGSAAGSGEAGFSPVLDLAAWATAMEATTLGSTAWEV